MQDRYHARVQKKAVQLARSFLWKQFQSMQSEAMKRNAYQKAYMSKDEWMRKSWRCIDSGGFLLLAKDEVLGDGLSKSVEDLKDELGHFVDDVDVAVADFWQEAFQAVDVPNKLAN